MDFILGVNVAVKLWNRVSEEQSKAQPSIVSKKCRKMRVLTCCCHIYILIE